MALPLRFVGRVSLVLLLLATAGETRAQRLRSRGLDGGSRGAARVMILEKLDRNNDGLLQFEEVPERMRPFLKRQAEARGLDPQKPVPIARLVGSDGGEATASAKEPDAQQASGGDEKKAGDTEDSGKPNAADPEKEASKGEPDAKDATKPDGKPKQPQSASSETNLGFAVAASSPSAPQVPGFGAEQDEPKVPGFATGERSDSAGTADAGAGSVGEEPASTKKSDYAARKIRRYAESLLKQYDKDKSGVLEPEEWKKMRGDPRRSDSNDDGIITVDELHSRLSSYSKRRGSWSSSPASSSRRSKPVGYRTSGKADGRTYGSRGRRELPEGLPSWFSLRDRNGDGQVAMAEFASSWTDAKAAEFLRWDLNGDGLLTPAECLAAEKRY